MTQGRPTLHEAVVYAQVRRLDAAGWPPNARWKSHGVWWWWHLDGPAVVLCGRIITGDTFLDDVANPDVVERFLPGDVERICAEVSEVMLSDDSDPRSAILTLRRALDEQDPRTVARDAKRLRRLYDACRDDWDDQAARHVEALLDEADEFGWCVGFQHECPEVRGLLDVLDNEGCRVHLRAGTVQIQSQNGASLLAQSAAGRLVNHCRDHAAEVWWMLTGQLPSE